MKILYLKQHSEAVHHKNSTTIPGKPAASSAEFTTSHAPHMYGELMRNSSPNTVLALLIATVAGCGDKDDDRATATQPQISGIDSLVTLTSGDSGNGGTGGASTGDAGTDSAGTGGASGMTSASGGSGPKFDVGTAPDAPPDDTGPVPCMDPNDPNCKCSIPDHAPCDAGIFDPFMAMGLNCPGELQVQATKYGAPGAIGVRTAFGQGGTFNPREGTEYAVIGSGLVADLDKETPVSDLNLDPTHCNDDVGAFDPGANLPSPLKPINVGGDCLQNPGLLGTGDCSNTLQEQFQAGGAANDYAELRFVLQVPPDVTSFSYDFAFFSVEYPDYYQSAFNDMYIGWLQSEKWTGNISFDQQGNPISLNAGFLDFKDDPSGFNPIPQFVGTCMRQHAGTNWLTTTAGVVPGETITVVFAIMDLSDSILDSYVFLDNFKWGCEPTGKPQTMPPG